MKSWLMAALLLFVASGAWADCPNIITAKSGLPGRFGEWTTTYDIRNGTFEARHNSGNIVSGNPHLHPKLRTIVAEGMQPPA